MCNLLKRHGLIWSFTENSSSNITNNHEQYMFLFELKVFIQFFYIYRSPVVPTQFPLEFLLLDEAPIVNRSYMYLLEIRWNMNLTKFRKHSFKYFHITFLFNLKLLTSNEKILRWDTFDIQVLIIVTIHHKSTHNNSREMLDFL